jgi:hypothetical protein
MEGITGLVNCQDKSMESVGGVAALRGGFTLLKLSEARTEVYATRIQLWPFCAMGVGL